MAEKTAVRGHSPGSGRVIDHVLCGPAGLERGRTAVPTLASSHGVTTLLTMGAKRDSSDRFAAFDVDVHGSASQCRCDSVFGLLA